MDWSGGVIPSLTPRSQSPTSATPNPPLPSGESNNNKSSPLSQSNETTSTTNDESSATATTTASPNPASLESEITNVIAGFGSFWGKVRKSSVNALAQAEKQIESARKDLTPLVEKARANLDHLGDATRAELQRLSEEASQGGSSGVMIGADGVPIMMDEVVDRPSPVTTKEDIKGKGVDRNGEANATPPINLADPSSGPTIEDTNAQPSSTTKEGSPSSPALSADAFATSATAFFNKMQSQLSTNPNLQGLSKNLTTLQTSVSTNLSTLPTSLQTNIHQLQQQFANQKLDLADTQKTAEDYLHKGEHWLAEFGSEVSRLAKEAIQVVPPGAGSTSGHVGGDDARSLIGGDRDAKRNDERMRKAEQVAGGRRETHLMRLRTDPSILLDDPAQPPTNGDHDAAAAAVAADLASAQQKVPSLSDSTMLPPNRDSREAYTRFVDTIESQGGFETELWQSKIVAELATPGPGGEGLEGLLRLLVPSRMSLQEFWSRYFFRVHEIDEDEVKRKLVLQGAETNEDDFSWDMEDEEDEAQEEEEGQQQNENSSADSAASNLPSSIISKPNPSSSTSRLTESRSGTTTTLNAANASSSTPQLSRTSSVSAGSEWGLDLSMTPEASGVSTPDHAATTTTTTITPLINSIASPLRQSISRRTAEGTSGEEHEGEGEGGAAESEVERRESTTSASASASATSPRASSDGQSTTGTTGSYDFVGVTSATPSERGTTTTTANLVDDHEQGDAMINKLTTETRTKVPLSETKGTASDAEEDEDSDWE